MSADQHARPAPDNLQFDRAVNAGLSGSKSGEACGRCDRSITVEYYHRDGQVLCRACKQQIEIEDRESAKRGLSAAGFSSAALFGFGAAIAGAAIYWGVGALTGLEIGLVAILIGFMVGAAVRMGASGHGGRRYQFLAAGLTWFAVALAYTPPFVHQMIESAATAADSVAADPPASQAAPDSDLVTGGAPDADRQVPAATPSSVDGAAAVDSAAAAPEIPGVGGILLVIVGMVLVIVALPAIAVIGSLPGGLINGLIIAFGLHQAWKMTAARDAQITGPYKVNTPPQAASA
jgi:hypothetical protein